MNPSSCSTAINLDICFLIANPQFLIIILGNTYNNARFKAITDQIVKLNIFQTLSGFSVDVPQIKILKKSQILHPEFQRAFVTINFKGFNLEKWKNLACSAT